MRISLRLDWNKINVIIKLVYSLICDNVSFGFVLFIGFKIKNEPDFVEKPLLRKQVTGNRSLPKDKNYVAWEYLSESQGCFKN